jgi:hypothetical protein
MQQLVTYVRQCYFTRVKIHDASVLRETEDHGRAAGKSSGQFGWPPKQIHVET